MILDIEKTLTEKTVLLTTNFTESSRNAARFAVQLFKDQSVKYVIMHSYYEPPVAHDALYSKEDLAERNSDEKLRHEIELIQKDFPKLKLEFECVIVFGLLAASINETVKRFEADYVVIGNKSSYNLESRLLGYKAANFIRKIEAPVIAVPADIEYKEMDVITFASDMKKIKNLDVLAPALDVVKRNDAKLNIVYVSADDELLVGQQAEAGLYLDNYFAEVSHEFHHSSSHFIIAGISRFVENSKSGMVVLLARKHNFFKRLVESSKTQMMSELAKVPLLVLHE